ncbi:MAG TPA: hypothetical protein VMG59_09910 [Phycisphaerae bacterium]|nr:hypothetical protein [Phycisphaerae bacterium]
MQISAEIRWFWFEYPPFAFKDWFCKADSHRIAAGGGGLRLDEYMCDRKQVELGVKLRGGKKGVEVKGLVSIIENGLEVEPFMGSIEIWTKWSSEILELNLKETVKTIKRRWLRKFDCFTAEPIEIELDHKENPKNGATLPSQGCNVELTEVTLASQDIWWTFGFEAFGTTETVEENLRKATTTISKRLHGEFTKGHLASYPVWLKDYASIKH